MKKMFFAVCCLSFLVFTNVSFADDNALTGVYLGGHLGAARYTSSSSAHFPFFGASAYDGHVSDTGLDLGLQGGQNFAFGKLLYGYVVDATLGLGTSKDESNNNGFFGATNDYSAKFNSVFSVRAKAGYLFNDATAVSLTFGPALGRFDITDTVPPCGFCSSSPSKTIFGAALGIGVEHAYKNNLVVSADLSHYFFKKKSAPLELNGVPYSGGGFSYTYSNKLDLLNVAVSYKF